MDVKSVTRFGFFVLDEKDPRYLPDRMLGSARAGYGVMKNG
jgi:hypothetical protein